VWLRFSELSNCSTGYIAEDFTVLIYVGDGEYADAPGDTPEEAYDAWLNALAATDDDDEEAEDDEEYVDERLIEDEDFDEDFDDDGNYIPLCERWL
jgi:hypothetical protein